MLRPDLDVVIPCFNEEAGVDLLVDALRETFSRKALDQAGVSEVRFIFIDDGSRDTTAAKLHAHLRNGLPGTLLILSRNFGHQSAVSAGLDVANARLVAVMDADLQDPPGVILQMIARWREGYEVVYAERRKRKEFFLKVAAYWVFYRILAFLSEVPVPKDAGDFCLMDQKVVEALRRLPERIRFPRGLRAWVGFRQCGFPYERRGRQRGETKYTLAKLYRLATDGIASMSTRALRITQLFTFLFALASLAFSGAAIWFLIDQRPEQPWAIWFILGYLLNASLGFMVMFALYILGAYVGRTYLEVKQRPSYIVREILRSDVRVDPS